MRKTTALRILIIFYIVAGTITSYAADTVSHKYPRVILLQIRSENNRITAMTRDRRIVELEEVRKDAKSAAAAMIQDFTDHFNYCPVYYFIDTNLDKVKQKNFERILMNLDGSQVTNPVINSSSIDYCIVFYGHPVAQRKNEDVVKDPMKYKYNNGEPFGVGLVINNDKYEQLSYLYKLDYSDLFISKKQKQYYYESEHYEIEYFPLAEPFNKKLAERSNKRNAKHFQK